ncbi:hypothetical protein MPH_03013 [Macrophomina phaseolina MS6]|uniref:Zn(2)-C6 fungal-type domain-containing protein n=1 Tax=Macrophomina phaseolina (strain MS6) TaxID=1126212 RepID=K2S3U4_MACPH|nr:hypothetical protein MPH_03013 [Macrophomina phaseolina MS6]
MPPKRSRTVEGSCWQCRKRRVLCDLSRPVCSRCSSANQPCEYSHTRLKWIDGVAARGKLAGRPVPVEAAFPREVPLLITQDGLLLYFANAVIPRFNLGTERLHIDLAAVNGDPVLQRAVVALANSHRALDAHLTTDDVVRAKGRARLTALETFRKQLDGEPASPEDLFLASVFHCVLDGIVEPTDETASMLCHFHGGKALLSYRGCLERLNAAHQGLFSFAISIFATMDLVHSLLSGAAPFFNEDWVLTRPGRHSWWGSLAAEDPFLDVLSILFRLAALGNHACMSQTSIRIEDLLSIQSALEKTGLKCCSHPRPRGASPVAQPTAFQDSWATFCSAYRCTALIYMYRALCNLDPAHELVQQATAEGVKAVCKDHLAGNIAHCMLFPMLIIGSHCVDQHQRQSILRALATNASYLAFGSIQLMESFLKERWSHGVSDSNWWDYYGDIASRTAVF